MRHLFLTGFMLVTVLTAGLRAQSSGPQMIDIYLTSLQKADYVDLSGKNILPTGKTQPNLESFVIGYKAWNLMGDFVYNPSFYYELNRTSLQGTRRQVFYKTISKYPDLARRYQAIRPSSVNFVITVGLRTKSNNVVPAHFKVINNDLAYFESRSGKNLQVPASPANGKWTKVFSSYGDFSENDRSDETELRELLKNFTEVGVLDTTTSPLKLDIKWDGEAIDEIGRLYDQYEKENKKIDDELKAVKNADQLVKPVAAYNKDDDMSAPFEEEAKSAEVFKTGNTVGLRAKGRIVFESANYSVAEPFKGLNNLFKLQSKDDYSYHIYNAKGKRLSVDGHSVFQRIEEGERPGTYKLLSKQEGSRAFYTTEYKYRSKSVNARGYFTQREFDDYVEYDKKPPARQTSSTSSSSSSCDGCYEVALPSYVQSYYRGTLYTVNDKLEVLASETVYY